MSEPTYTTPPADKEAPSDSAVELSDAGKALIKSERDRANTLDRELRALKEQLGEDNGAAALLSERSQNAKLANELGTLRKELDKVNQANESVVEKAQREANEFKEAAAKAATEALRYRIAAETGITDNADLILTASDEETMRKQAELWATRTPTSPRPDPSQGAKGAGSKGTPADSFAEFFQSNI